MKIITLAAVIAILLIELSGVLPKSSVGGPLTLMLVFLLAMLAAGIHEAWSQKRGVLGWIVSIVTAFVGGFVGVEAGNMAMELLMPHLQIEGSFASTRHPMLYVSSAGMVLLTMLGSWTALTMVNRFR